MSDPGAEGSRPAGERSPWAHPKGVVALCFLGIASVLCSGFLLLDLDPESRAGFEVLLQDAPEPSEVLRLAERLCKEGIANRIEDGGRTLCVAREQHQEAVRLVMEEGMAPSGEAEKDTGFFGLGGGLEVGNPEESRARHRRARESDLARTLSLYPSVQFARVHLNLPDPGTFGKAAAEPSASIFLGLRPFRRLSAAQAKAIRGLVAHAVKGLRVERVVLADSRGTDYETLIREDETEELRRMEEHLAVLREAEARAEGKLLRHLRPLLGHRNVTVTVASDLRRRTDDAGQPLAYRSLVVTVNSRSLERQTLTTSMSLRLRRSALAALGLDEAQAPRLQIEALPFQEDPEVAPPPTPEPPAPAAEAREPTSPFALPLGLFCLLGGSLGVVRMARNAPSPACLRSRGETVDAVTLGQDPAERRCWVATWSEDDPEFAARILARLAREEEPGA